MKLLRNPIAVAVLGLAALVLLYLRLAPYIMPRRSSQGPTVSAAPVPPPKPAPVATSGLPTIGPSTAAAPMISSPTNAPGGWGGLAAVTAAPGSEIELDIVRRDEARWSLGRRDPFQIRSTSSKPIYPRAMEVLTLSGVWRQSESSLAVLNGKIYMAGDTVLRFMIKSIESDRVLVQGPNGSEIVEFKAAAQARIPGAPGEVQKPADTLNPSTELRPIR